MFYASGVLGENQKPVAHTTSRLLLGCATQGLKSGHWVFNRDFGDMFDGDFAGSTFCVFATL